ncbi:MAG: histone deacetylase [Desulfotalea sp.]
MTSSRLGIVYDERLFFHSIDTFSRENADRLRNIYSCLDKSIQQNFRVPIRSATNEEILSVHSQFYLDQLEKHCQGDAPYSYDRDTYLMQDSLSTAYLASGGCLALADAIMAGDVDNGFAVVRPPGHHAEAGQGMGFCLINHIAVTAEYLRKKHGLSRILILDFDVHHGNGTDSIFKESSEVLFVSIHQEKLFPFTGLSSDCGEGEGEGYTINLPVPQQFGDHEYTYLMGKVLGAVVEQFMPQIILVSAGYDGHTEDNISKMLLSTEWYQNITRMLKYYAADCCDGKLLYVLEGGYNPDCLEHGVLSTIDALAQSKSGVPGVSHSERAAKVLDGHILHKKWTI